MQSIFAGASLAGWTEGKNVRTDHVGFGVVLGEDGYEIKLLYLLNLMFFYNRRRLRARAGEAVRLRDLLDEGLERSMAKLKEKDRHNVMTKNLYSIH
jgi:arginyl-tRNA synthetase